MDERERIVSARLDEQNPGWRNLDRNHGCATCGAWTEMIVAREFPGGHDLVTFFCEEHEPVSLEELRAAFAKTKADGQP